MSPPLVGSILLAINGRDVVHTRRRLHRSAGTYVNLGYYTTSEDAQAQGYGAIINTPPSLCSNCFPTVTGFGTFTATQVPEIDPTSAASGLALLIGGVAVLRGRRQQSVA